MLKSLENKSVRDVFLQGLLASAAPIFFGAVAKRLRRDTVFVLSDADEAGYFFNDLNDQTVPGAMPMVAKQGASGGGTKAAEEAPKPSLAGGKQVSDCLLYTSPSPRDLSTSRMPSSA